MKPLNERPWIGTPEEKGAEGGLDIRGEDLSTMKHQKMGRAGVKLREWLETRPDGGIVLMSYVL